MPVDRSCPGRSMRAGSRPLGVQQGVQRVLRTPGVSTQHLSGPELASAGRDRGSCAKSFRVPGAMLCGTPTGGGLGKGCGGWVERVPEAD
jgi:hypothetical protein